MAVGNPGDEGKTCIDEIMCTRVPGQPFRRDALSRPVRLLGQYEEHVRYARRLRPCI